MMWTKIIAGIVEFFLYFAKPLAKLFSDWMDKKQKEKEQAAADVASVNTQHATDAPIVTDIDVQTHPGNPNYQGIEGKK